MTVIRKGSDLCTVIVTVDADEDVMPELEAHAKDGLKRFGEFEGFVSGRCTRATTASVLFSIYSGKAKRRT